MLPPVDAASLQDALARFDRELRPLPGWSHWEDNRAHKYAIRAAGQLYPVKQVISLATGVPVSDFSGGEGSTQAND